MSMSSSTLSESEGTPKPRAPKTPDPNTQIASRRTGAVGGGIAGAIVGGALAGPVGAVVGAAMAGIAASSLLSEPDTDEELD